MHVKKQKMSQFGVNWNSEGSRSHRPPPFTRSYYLLQRQERRGMAKKRANMNVSSAGAHRVTSCSSPVPMYALVMNVEKDLHAVPFVVLSFKKHKRFIFRSEYIILHSILTMDT